MESKIELLLQEILRELRLLNEEVRTLKRGPYSADSPPEELLTISTRVGSRLIAIRRQLGYNQTQMGKLLGRSGVGVSAWERGEVRIPRCVAEEICRLGSTTMEILFEEKEEHD